MDRLDRPVSELLREDSSTQAARSRKERVMERWWPKGTKEGEKGGRGLAADVGGYVGTKAGAYSLSASFASFGKSSSQPQREGHGAVVAERNERGRKRGRGFGGGRRRGACATSSLGRNFNLTQWVSCAVRVAVRDGIVPRGDSTEIQFPGCRGVTDKRREDRYLYRAVGNPGIDAVGGDGRMTLPLAAAEGQRHYNLSSPSWNSADSAGLKSGIGGVFLAASSSS